jgi:hypothetical protein
VYTLGAVGVLAVIGVFWFLVLGPKRSDLSELNAQVEASETSLQAARQEAEQFAQARLDFPTDYATVARLGKAVPVDPDVPSLVVQLDRAANAAKVSFTALKLEKDDSKNAASSPPPAAPSGEGSGAASGTTGAAGATGASGASAGATGASGAAPADAAAAAGMPAGTDVGSAVLSMTKLNLTFQGSFFRMADFIHNIRSLVRRRNRQLFVSGRLVTIDGILLGAGREGFPKVKATMAVRSYVLPQTQGLFAGATAQGPAGATAATPAPPSSPGAGASAPPAAVVSPR